MLRHNWQICKKYVLSNSEKCSMRRSRAMTMLHIVLDTFNVCVQVVSAQVIRGLSGRVIQHPPPQKKKRAFFGGMFF